MIRTLIVIVPDRLDRIRLCPIRIYQTLILFARDGMRVRCNLARGVGRIPDTEKTVF